MLEVASFLINIVGSAGYFAGTLQRQYRPERTSWIIWSGILAVTFFSYRALGAEESLWFIAGDLTATTAIMVVSLWFGVGGLTKLDRVMLLLGFSGLAIWIIFNTPLVALLCGLFADMCGAVPTLKKSLADPQSESAYMYAASCVASAIGVYLVGQWSLVLLVYPLYLFLINGATALMVAVGRYHVQRSS